MAPPFTCLIIHQLLSLQAISSEATTTSKPHNPLYFLLPTNTMHERLSHGTYVEERRYFLTTLHAQIDILRDNHQGTRRMIINSLSLLLLRVDGLRMAGQACYNYDNPNWTAKCNKLYERVQSFRDTLSTDPTSIHRVATDIESMLIFLDFCVPADIEYRISPDRGDRSGAPSPEPRP
ncbi:hypothetical protein VN97_g5793 [Penicillium thymicola]|uniref:Uncharacterized protein n=1 Tax=Penicillium thymicola TaxID=293382 RepID=A0AAI9X8C0_PENTH|nr:hypothetical protein VN97_g5793 [Penicillium thymicola]